MNEKTKKFLLIFFLVVGILYFVFHGMAMAKSVLAPIFLAIILAMMLAPVSSFLERKGLNRGWASFFSDLIFLLLIVGILWAVGYEIQRMAKDWSSIEDRLNSQITQVISFVEKKTGLSLDNPLSGQAGQQEGQGNQPEGARTVNQANQNQQSQNQQVQGGQSGGIGGGVKSWLTTVAKSLFNSLSTVLLIAVYIFFMLLYRKKFEKAVLKFIPEENRSNGKRILSEIKKDSQQYMFGNLLLVGLLTVIYAIGFIISGMSSPFTTAFLAAVLSLIPYVGNIVGGVIAVGLAYITTGELSAVWIVLGTFLGAQFIESYLIEPYLVGGRIKVNPLFTILSVTIGAAVWGVIGMIVFLPLFSFVKAVADHVPLLHPLGYLIGKESGNK